MASADNSGNLSFIDSDDELDDGKTASEVKPGVTHADTKKEQESKLENSGIPSRELTKKIFNELEARKLLMFYNDELHKSKVEMSISKEEGKESVTLSSRNPTLLVTEKQRLGNLLDSIKCQKMMSTCKPQNEIDSIIESQNLKILLSKDENGQFVLYFKDPLEYENLQSSMKPSSSTRRRNRTFESSENASFSSASANKDNDEYESGLKWQSKNEDDIHEVLREEDNSSSTTFLGENVQVRKEIRQNGICTKIYKGSIIKAKVEAIVNAANEYLDNCGGVAEVISKAAGGEVDRECKDKMRRWTKIKVTENIVTRAGNLPCQWIIHAVGPRWSNYKDKEEALQSLYKTVVNILSTASERQMKSVVMPPISSGIFGVPKQACAAMYIKALLDFSEEYQKAKVKEFHIIDNKSDMLDLICEEYEECYKKGRKYLEPRTVLERLQIRSYKTSGWSKSNNLNPSNNFRTNTRSDDSSNNILPNTAQRGQSFQKYTVKEISPGEFRIDDILKVVVFTENILQLKNVDILVCAEGKDKNISGRIAKTILEKVTTKEKKHIQKIISGTQHYSDVLQTNFGVGGYNMIFFAIVRRFGDGKPRHEDLKLLENTTSNVLEKANKKKKSGRKNTQLSIAVPLLGTGSTKNTGYLQDYANVMCDSIVGFRKHIEDKTRLRTIHLVNFDESATKALVQAFKSRLSSQTVKQNTFNFSPMGASNPNPKRSQFDRTKYKLKEEWRAIEKPKYDFNSFIKGVEKQKKTLQENTKDNGNDATGNLVVIESDEESETEQSTEGACSDVGKTEVNKSVDPANDDFVSEDSSLTCVICMDTEMEDPVILRTCHHQFCRDCIEDYFSSKPVCPVCNTIYGELFGNQPPGTATVYKDYASLPGFSCSTLIIDYNIPDGKQTEEHPNPDQPFTGVSRQAYLPDNEEGNKVLGMLEKAFKHRLIFTIGFSRTSGKDNMVTWNDIHHKTRREGGPEKFGYPDREYIERVKEELAAKGITEN